MLAATVAAGWFESVTARNTQAPPQPRTSAARLRTPRPADDAIPNTERLREWLNQPPTPALGRNPFVYGSRASSHAPAISVMPEMPAPAPETPAPLTPVFTLSGIASTVENGAAVLTAIVIDSGAMVFVKAGDRLTNGYSVVRVEEMSVTLTGANGVTQTIRLP